MQSVLPAPHNSTPFTKMVPSYWHNPGQAPQTPHTLGRLLDIADDRWGDREALLSLHEDRRLTFREARETVDKLAAGLLQLGLKTGDRIGVWGHNSSQWYITYLAAARAGLITVKLTPEYEPSELLYTLNKVEIQAIVCDEICGSRSSVEKLTHIIPELSACQDSDVEFQSSQVPSLTRVILISDRKFPGICRFQDVMDSATPQNVDRIRKSQIMIQPDDACDIIFTSGTTGKSKGAILSHHSIINNAIVYGRRVCLNEESRYCLFTQFSHTSASCLAIISCLYYGATLIIPGPQFYPTETVKTIRDERCTIVLGSPSQFINILVALDEEPNLTPTTLETVVMGTAPVSPTLVKNIMKNLKPVRVSIAYGMTETGPLTFLSQSSDVPEKSAYTVGYVYEHLEVKVVDQEGRMVPMETSGELWVRGNSIMLGYWNDDEKTKSTVTPEGWLKTGDLFVLQKDGYGKVVGRLKDMIIKDNTNVFPIEIEDFLSTHPDILEVQIVGVPDPRMGEELYAFIRPRNSKKLTEQKVRDFCKGKLAEFRIPRHIEFVSDYPRTVLGKVQKMILKERALQELGIQTDTIWT
ncbi:medium-chain acyl-CoA ligase ACSF2, mitochondrial-like isoform X1 [Periplaneta americana]|uniref:medium-chain acyl-CoA ligase ACSF2, mitochondrial-like isoform X1 n=1 Tax=Periplaneta americana TaxID=6978 RepID=UPI0037E982DE